MNVGIIGAGVMGRMLANSFTAAKHEISVSDICGEKLNFATSNRRIHVAKNNVEVVQLSEVVFLAIKPQQFDSVVDDLAGILTEKKILVSVLAGTPMSKYIKKLGEIKLVRIMPNLAISIGKGVVGVAYHGTVDDEDREKIEQLLNPLGTIVPVEEKQIDAITALAGSGPAYIFLLIEALADAGVRIGFPYQQALEMVLAVIEGSAALVKKTKKHPAELRAMVSSPSGTTVEGLYVLEKAAVRSALIKAVLKAYKRAQELSSDS